ncbi:MAG: response regulator transcription factor [Chlorobiaceae bacterium]|nr:response regulator transcription factor [Chlorobiaceae bacterium]
MMLLSKRIIIVEDDRDLLENMVKYLRLAGYEVTGTASAGEFYRHIATEAFSLAVIDIGLPDQSGLVLSEYVRNNTDMRIILLTARSTLDDKLNGLKSGADFYMVKPVDCSELSATIENMFMRLGAEHPAMLEDVHGIPPAPARQVAPWRLDGKGWVLYTPEGREIRLTAKEYKFMDTLVREPAAIVSRREILKILEYPPTGQASHALESMISRLRRKIEGMHGEFPVKTSHGEGYCLTVAILRS